MFIQKNTLIMRQFFFLFFLIQTGFIFGQGFNSTYYYEYIGKYANINAINTDESNNLYITGRVTGAIDFDPSNEEFYSPSSLYREVFVAKYDKENKFLNAFFIESSNLIYVRNIEIDKDENIYLSGTFTGRVDFDLSDQVHELSSYENGKMFVAKYTSQGELVWVDQFGNPNFDTWASNFSIANNKLNLLVSFYGKVDFDPGANELIYDGWGDNAILELDLNGNLVWVGINDSETDARYLIKDNNNNMYISGNFYNKANFDFFGTYELTPEFIGGDAFLAKYNSAHELLWVNTYGTDWSSESFSNIAINSDNEVVCLGFTEKGGIQIGDFTVNEPASILMNISENGHYNKILTLPYAPTYFFDLEIDSKGNIYTIGGFKEEITFNFPNEIKVLTPINEKTNRFLLKMDKDFNLSVLESVVSNEFFQSTFHIDNNDYLYVSQSFKEWGIPLFGSDIEITVDNQLTAIYQKISPFTCETIYDTLFLSDCDSVNINGFTYYHDSIYEQLLTTEQGCDSILTIFVELAHSTTDTINKIECNDYLWEGQTFDKSGVYNKTFISDKGCDSILTLNLTILQNSEESLELLACDQIMINDINYTESGEYQQILINSEGCDSILNLKIKITTINEEVGIGDNYLFSKEDNADNYQWYDCNNNSKILGANNKEFYPESSGDFSVHINKGDCIKNSDCANFIHTSTKNTSKFRINIFPNPFKDKLLIEYDKNILPNLTIKIYNLVGSEVLTLTKINSLNLEELKKAVYIFEFWNNGKKIGTKKIVKL